MPSTRSSARQSDTDPNSSPPSAKSNAGIKRKADDATSPSSNKVKRGRSSKDQKTLEESLPAKEHAAESKDTEMSEAKSVTQSEGEESMRPDGCWGWIDKVTYDRSENKNANGVNALEQVKADEKDAGTTHKENEKSDGGKDEKKEVKEVEGKEGSGGAEASNTAVDKAVENDKKREDAMPSNILEKGIIYFFSRGRVGVDDPDSVQDLARSYFVMRPLPAGGKLTDGAIQDLQNNRLIALPKKVWPKSGKDRFMVFVEKAKTSVETLKKEFFAGSEYSTKTTGTRQTPEVTPLGEGVYAITSTGSGRPTTHLAYMMTVPEKLGEVQSDVGLAEKGSFVLSLKNPESSGPAYAQLPQSPDFPKDFIEEFQGRGWMAAHPKHLDYPNAQMLLIGEDFDSSSNLDPVPKDERDQDKETPQEELEKLEDEDEYRVENLKGDDTIFDDLGISKNDYPKVMTTW